MRDWLRGRRNALIDAALIYLAAEWVGPFLFSAVVYLGATEWGIWVLAMIGYYSLLAVSIAIFGLPSASAVTRMPGMPYPFVGVHGIARR